MVAYRKTRIYQILMLASAITLSSCFTDDYDLSNGINTDMSVGGDSLSIPIGKTDSIFLGSLLDGQDSTLLQETSDGSYLLSFNDSIAPVKVDGVSPVSFSISPISISPISTSFATIKFPSFGFNPIVIASDLPIPDLAIANKTINPINSTFAISKALTIPSFVAKKQGVAGSTKISNAKNFVFSTGLISLADNRTIDQTLNFAFPTQLKKINKIQFINSKVTLTFDKTKINQLPFSSQNDTIKSFRIDYPAEFKLVSNTGRGSRISGSSFIIENAVLSATENIYTATFIVESLDMSGKTQNGALNYTAPIPYSIDYSFIGTTESDNLPANPKLEVGVSLQSAAVIDNMDIETNPFAVAVPDGKSIINQIVSNIPTDISEVRTLTFENGAALDLNISDPNINPLKFSAGTCTISLPKLIQFKPYSGLNTTTNELTIPYNELYTPRSIGITGITLNKTIANQQISITDELNYSISGLMIGSAATDLNKIQTFNNKKLNVAGNMVNLTVKDANIKTKSISFAIPSQNSSINISQLVSVDVKKIYTVSLKNPASLKLTIDVSNLPTSIDSLFFDNYVISLPGSLKFSADSEITKNTTTNKNVLTLNRGFKISEGFSKTLLLEMFDFGTVGKDLVNGVFSLNEAITMQGNAYVKGTDLNSSQIGTVEVKPAITVGNMSLSLIEAKLSPAIDAISESIKLDLPDAIKNGDNNLGKMKPVITFEVGNTMGMPLSINLDLVPMSKGVAIPQATVSTTLDIAAATVLGQTTWSKFRLSTTPIVDFDGYKNKAIENLANLLKTIPDSIAVRVTPTIIGDRHKVDLYSKKNQLDIKYGLNVPLEFEEDFKVQFSDTIDGLKSSLEEILKLTNKIEIEAVVNSQIPMNLGFNITPLDSSDKIIGGISMDSVSVKYNSLEPISFGLKETVAGDLKKLDKIIIKVSASKNAALSLIPLKADQYFIVELRVRIPNGITIKE